MANYEVFISYHSQDLDLAVDLHERLTGAGFVVWFDKVRLAPGCDWHAEIEAACEASRIVIPVLTPNWQKSEWTRFETYGAENIVPLVYDASWEEVASAPLRRYQYFPGDVRCMQDEEWSRFVDRLRELLAQPPPDKTGRMAHLDRRANPYFVGREAALNRVHETLHGKPTAALTQGAVQTIVALGGIGKTTLVREYAEKFWRLYEQILWVDARGGAERGFAQLADVLAPDTGLHEESDRARLALRILNEGAERLLVLDDAEDEEAVQDWIPSSGGCHTLITSRFKEWSAVVETLQLDELEPDGALDFLLRRTGRNATAENRTACAHLTKLLGCLPLALEQAAAYIRESGAEFGFDDYERLYERATRALLSKSILVSGQRPDSVATTWSASIERLSSSARGILRLASYLAPEPIPIDMFIASAADIRRLAQTIPYAESDASASDATDELFVRDALRDLARFSLAQLHGQRFTVHTLVQTVERLDTPVEHRRDWINNAIVAFLHHAPLQSDDFFERRVWATLEPHATRLAEHAAEVELQGIEVPLLKSLGQYLYGIASYGRAEPILRKAVELATASNSVELAQCLGILGILLADTNRLSEAQDVLRRALMLTEDRQDRATAVALNNLAYALKLDGKLSEAESLYRACVKLYEAELDTHDAAYATALSNWAKALGDLHRFDEGVELLRRAIPIMETQCGPRHPRTATAISTLAEVIFAKCTVAIGPAMRRETTAVPQSVGQDASEAERLYRAGLEMMQEAYPQGHTSLANAMAGLGTFLNLTGDLAQLDEAASLYRRVVEIRERLLGPDHPTTLSARQELQQLENDLDAMLKLVRQSEQELLEAKLLVTRGAQHEAEAKFRDAMQKMVDAHIQQSPHMAAAMHELALLISDRGEEAESLMRGAIEIDQAIYGDNHPEVGTDLASLARILYEQKRLDEAVEPLQKALAITKSQQTMNPQVLLRRSQDLAFLMRKLERLDEAKALYESALDCAMVAYGGESAQAREIAKTLSVIDGEIQATATSIKGRWRVLYEHARTWLLSCVGR